MTEYEYIDLISTLRSEGGFHGMNMVGTVMAYLLVTHFAGHRISSLQATAITVLYTAFLVIPIGTNVAVVANLREVIQSYESSYPEGIVSFSSLGENGNLYVLCVYILGWLLSLTYMWIVRHARTA